jgi:hypothetical protein
MSGVQVAADDALDGAAPADWEEVARTAPPMASDRLDAVRASLDTITFAPPVKEAGCPLPLDVVGKITERNLYRNSHC